jgi:membrane protease subunit (stomatin/prohibitin family)
MGFFEVIEYHDETGNELCRKIPESGSAETRMGSQLVVREYQQAVFFRDGKGLDVLGSGRHTLTTQNIPVLARLIRLTFDDRKSPFHTEVVFVNTKVFNDIK